MLRQAELALNQGRTAEAAKLVKAAMVNQYLSPGDRQALQNLNVRMQPGGPTPQGFGAVKGDAKSLLAAARAAYKAGELDAAEALAHDAERAGAASSWLQPWADTPAKVRRDVQAARAEQGPVVVRGPVETPQPNDAAKSPPGMRNFSSKDIPPPAPLQSPLQGPSLSPYASGLAPSPLSGSPPIKVPPLPVVSLPTPVMPSVPVPSVPVLPPARQRPGRSSRPSRNCRSLAPSCRSAQ